jgi:hypothetical protein
MRMLRPAPVITALLAAALLSATMLACAQQAPLQQRMGPEAFKAAGLDKLSPQELQNLDAWLADHGSKPATRVVDSSGAPVFYPDSGKRTAVDAHIVGHFGGWSGHDQVTLDNGQQWRQIGDDRPQCGATDNPSIRIKPSLFGNWLAHVQGCNDTVHVKRVQ